MFAVLFELLEQLGVVTLVTTNVMGTEAIPGAGVHHNRRRTCCGREIGGIRVDANGRAIHAPRGIGSVGEAVGTVDKGAKKTLSEVCEGVLNPSDRDVSTGDAKPAVADLVRSFGQGPDIDSSGHVALDSPHV